MKSIVQGSIVLALVLILGIVPSALGYDPEDCLLSAYCTGLPTATPVPVPTPLGDSAATAREVTGEWEHIGPNTSVWYRLHDARLQLSVWLYTNGQSGVSLAIYAPDQDLSKPVGRGSYNKFQPSDLFWTGRSRAFGTWYAVITNSNPFAVAYRLEYTRSIRSTADRCSTCHGWEIEWERCEPPDSAHCTNLREEYGH